MTIKEHLIVTSPDRFWEDAIYITLIDIPLETVENILSMLKGSPSRLIFYIYQTEDSDAKWLLDVVNQSDIVLMNLSMNTHLDVIKGYILPKKNVFYYGRSDLFSLFTNFWTDPVGKLLASVGELLSASTK